MIGSRQENKPENKDATPLSNVSGNTNGASAQYSASQSKPVSTGPKSDAALPTAVIGPKIRFKGELVGEEDLLVQGVIEGTIDLKNHNLTIGQQGVIKANAKAKTIIIEGKVDGDLHGEERIVIKESSNVSGNIVAERVSLEDGAKFRGSIDMDVKSALAKPAESKPKSQNGKS